MNPLLPREAEVVDRIQESPGIFTLRLRLSEPDERGRFAFAPGQFNMVYLYGVGEVAISIVSDPHDPTLLDHTIRAVGRVTNGLSRLGKGDRLGLRGPFGRGWPLDRIAGHDVAVVTGGLGCAPVVAAINYMLLRRTNFGRITIVQGVKHSDELIWRERYAYWRSLPGVRVLIAADQGGPLWPYHVGLVTDVFDQVDLDHGSAALLCGPEPMMVAAARLLAQRGVCEDDIWLSMERNMQCAVKHCGHCQYGADFVCHDGPVFRYPKVKAALGRRGL
jgi:sulfhydrogenase subunit gamma (sulfur reductase)